jgi:hypothetical protein
VLKHVNRAKLSTKLLLSPCAARVETVATLGTEARSTGTGTGTETDAGLIAVANTARGAPCRGQGRGHVTALDREGGILLLMEAVNCGR